MIDIKNRYEHLLHLAKDNGYQENEIALIEKAYNFATSAHANQKRKSGDLFIIHPLETSIKLVEWKMDANTIAAGLLHDVIEDTEISEDQINKEFGSDITNLVKLVTKIALVAKKNREASQLKNLSTNYQIQVFMSISKDIRAIIIKLADRFHNLSTIGFLAIDRQRAIAQETFDIYANIAGRLGMYNVKTELLDIAFSIINREAYEQTLSIMNEYKLINSDQWKAITEQIQHLLEEQNIKYFFESRIKSVYSTYNKLNSISRINNIHDVYALRIILNDELDIYHVLGLIHLNFKYIPKFFKDYVSAPKNNLYQSVHTTIISNKTLVEIQIRTKRMDQNSKLGYASHWLYKEKNNLDLTQEAMQRFQVELFADESSNKNPALLKELTKIPIIDVIVTNNQNTYTIPASSTVLDLAYRVDPEKFAYINGIYLFGEKLAWDAHLENGDAIEITYHDKPQVSERWMRYVSNPTVRKHIFEIIGSLEKIEYTSAQNFLNVLNTTLKENRIGDGEIIERLKILKIKSIKEYLSYVAVLHLSVDDKINFFAKGNRWKSVLKEIRRQNNRWIFSQSYFELISGLKINGIEITKCCSKLPYMPLVGIIHKTRLYVHRPQCQTIQGIKDAKLVSLHWNKKMLEHHPRKFRANVEITGPWSESVINTIVLTILRNQGSLQEITVNRNKTTDQFKANVVLYVTTITHLNHGMDELILRNLNFKWTLI
ncbi:RelA/SpoT family protein [[Mycoplasma] testudinis]|uniref:RelA/SpoT family protein n=1 Tax=[Mycoplasma] testudinis TaxID=33924 RepID=UPI000698C5DD|nr:RelA/SpoT family protein [[Mycoplasma] testudinis]